MKTTFGRFSNEQKQTGLFAIAAIAPNASTPTTFRVSLKVGAREFYGEGSSAQASKHDAASKALDVLRRLPRICPNSATSPPKQPTKCLNPASLPFVPGHPVATASAATAAASTKKNSAAVATASVAAGGGEANCRSTEFDDLKSPVSQVHESALKRSMTVSFEVLRESGPPHMRTFRTRCVVGEHIAEGEGNGKKVRIALLSQGGPSDRGRHCVDNT